MLLQSATAFFITKCDGLLLQSATAFLLQSAQVLLQIATGITKCDNFITKCDRYYKVRRLLQSATGHTLRNRRLQDIAGLMYKVKNNISLKHIADLFRRTDTKYLLKN